MGKGDTRSRRGKLFRGTFGASRKHKSATSAASPAPAVKAESPKKKTSKKKKED